MVRVFVTGGTGYMGQALIPLLKDRGHFVTALVRSGSELKLRAACPYIVGDPLDPLTFAAKVPESDVLVHLVGVPHPSPRKSKQFRAVDQVSLHAAVAVAVACHIPHLVYVSVAQPAPVMRAYQQIRAECEAAIRDSGLNASILRPWYVLGPGHRWPVILIPLYSVLERLDRTRDAATRLGLVTRKQMVNALVWAVEDPPAGVRITTVAEIRRIPTLCRTSRDRATPERSATHG